MTKNQPLLTHIIVILGPTASGKTDASIELSKMIECEILSADSRQIYRYLDIGTAKPSQEEQKQAKHHFIDLINPDEYYSAGIFGHQAELVIEDLFNNKKTPLVVGGSGLYIKALCEGLFKEDSEFDSDNIRITLENQLENEGIDSLYNQLLKIDKPSAELYSDKNPRRILRALQYYFNTGIPLSRAQIEKKEVKKFKTLYFGIHFEREELYNRINQRTDIMFEKGLITETQKVLEMGYSPKMNSLNTVGYKESIAFVNGEISREKAVELTKQNTRRYAKRQLTWFRKNNEIKWLAGSNGKLIAEKIYNDINFS
ncbi:MAG: tRNA (adenosine(37)-N6)-dimethylallyltransferase MiaA [Ignavibacteriae bacterium]|nr:tRNA (adenosine(37)-N6)-dimethylallyltransferase MiaA [Ignavibacteriota bacterium]